VVGVVGARLGDAGVNIAGAQVSRTAQGGDALMALTVDSAWRTRCSSSWPARSAPSRSAPSTLSVTSFARTTARAWRTPRPAAAPSARACPAARRGPARYLEDLGGLDPERTLVLLDARATGHSEVPADPSTLRFDRLAEDVEALREHLGEERVDLLGHSAGTVVAQAYAAAHGERLRSLVLVTPTSRLQGGERGDARGHPRGPGRRALVREPPRRRCRSRTRRRRSSRR
jgi:hypothetical protein